jgi:Tol biopolymer transport system component
VAAALAVVLAGRAFLAGPTAPAADERRVEIETPAGQQRVYSTVPMISPDGNLQVMAAADSTRTPHLWLRELDAFEYRPLKGTEGASFPFWSPDSRSIAFFKGGALQRLSLADGAIQGIATGIAGPRGGNWSADGTIIYTPTSNTGIWRVNAAGGAPQPVTRVDSTLVDASHRFPAWLPDGKHFLFALFSNNPHVQSDVGGIYVASVDGGEPRKLTPDVGSFVVLPTGHLLVRRNGDLVAVPIDLESFAVGAPVVTVAERVGFGSNSGLVRASASIAGDIAFASATDLPPTDLAWLDRFGRRGEALGLRSKFSGIVLSPDGGQVAGEMGDVNGLSQIWTAALARRTVSRLTRDQNDSYAPAWSPDGLRVAYSNRDTGNEDLYIQLAAGTRPKELVVAAREVDTADVDWSADGRYLLFTGVPRSGKPHEQVWVADLQAGSASAVLDGEFDQGDPCLSPDGRWLAYVSNESGRDEVFVRSFPDLERRWQVSTAGGTLPHWRRDAREIVFTTDTGGERALWSVSLAPKGPDLELGEPERRFQWPSDVIDVSPSADHQRFLALVQPNAAAEPAMHLVLNWQPGDRP